MRESRRRNMKNSELSIFYLIDLLKKRWWGILIAALIGATAAFCYSSFMVTSLYQTTVKMYVNPSAEDQQSVQTQYSDYTLAINIINTYIELLNTNSFMQSVSDATGKRYTTNQLKKMIAFEVPEKTKIFNFSVQASNAEDSYKIATVVSELAPKKIIETTNASVVAVADPPVKPMEPFNNNTGRNTILGLIIGIAIAVGVVIVIDMFDVRVKSEEDLINTYELPVLGCIPNFEKIYRNKAHNAKTKPVAAKKN